MDDCRQWDDRQLMITDNGNDRQYIDYRQWE